MYSANSHILLSMQAALVTYKIKNFYIIGWLKQAIYYCAALVGYKSKIFTKLIPVIHFF